ncbi:MAG: prepilin peptidase [Coprobacillaceae bacterium]
MLIIIMMFLAYRISKEYIDKIENKRTSFHFQYFIPANINIIISYYGLNDYKINISSILVFLICIILIVIEIVDRRTMIIPNVLLVFLLIIVCIYTLIERDVYMYQRIIGIFIISIPMVIINEWFIESFGGGDIKLLMIMGYLLGFIEVMLVMVIAILLGGLSVSWRMFLKKEKLQAYIPFAPYLCTGIIIVIFYGKNIIS